MEHTHEFDCPICGAHLDSKDDLTRHQHDQHESRQASQSDGDSEPIGDEQGRGDSEEDQQ